MQRIPAAVRNVDRLVRLTIIRSWTSGLLPAGGIGLLALNFALYIVDIVRAPDWSAGEIEPQMPAIEFIGPCPFEDSAKNGETPCQVDSFSLPHGTSLEVASKYVIPSQGQP